MTDKVRCSCPLCGKVKEFEDEVGEFKCCDRVWKFENIIVGNSNSLLCYLKSLDLRLEV